VAIIFQNRLLNEIIESIKRDRVLACVPRLLENLRRKIEHDFPRNIDPSSRSSWTIRWWKYRDVHRLFGYKFMGFVTGGAT
jgi:long-chain acyl-CoA synthetase